MEIVNCPSCGEFLFEYRKTAGVEIHQRLKCHNRRCHRRVEVVVTTRGVTFGTIDKAPRQRGIYAQAI